MLYADSDLCIYYIYTHLELPRHPKQGPFTKGPPCRGPLGKGGWHKDAESLLFMVPSSQKKCAKRKLSRHASNCQHVGPGIHGPFTLWEVLSRCGRSFSRWFTRPKLMHWDWGTPICRTNETFVLFFESSHESNLDWLIAVVLNWPASVEGELGNFKQFGQHPSWVVLGK